jgi:replication factor C subunit 3/5
MDIPFVEKYRPQDFSNIVLDEENKLFFKHVMTSYIPNMLFYGPPGTGKTTTIINLIKHYQQTHGELNSGLMIHLNSSDDRGIDTIRLQISTFMQSKPMFKHGKKFIVLDEIDSMTKSAQQSLSYLLQTNSDVTVCLICNYISKIDTSLQSLFIKIKFNHLPPTDIFNFLKHIVVSEKLEYMDEHLHIIQKQYGSDLRSMINYIQLNHHHRGTCIQEKDMDTLYDIFINKENKDTIFQQVYALSHTYNMDIKHLLKDFLFYVSLKYPLDMDKMSVLIHSPVSNDQFISYIMNKLI